MKKFYSYLRVSTKSQGEHGLGIEAQREAVARYVQQTRGDLLGEFVEVESGAVRDRPVLDRCLKECRERKATLIVAKLDRLGRNVAFVSQLMEAGTDFLALDAPYANKLLLHVLSAVAEHERTIIAERTKAALRAAKERGVVLGANGKVLAQKHKAAAVDFAEQLRQPVTAFIARGNQTLSSVAEHLNGAGFRSREGHPWNTGTVSRVLRRLDLRSGQKGARSGEVNFT